MKIVVALIKYRPIKNLKLAREAGIGPANRLEVRPLILEGVNIDIFKRNMLSIQVF